MKRTIPVILLLLTISRLSYAPHGDLRPTPLSPRVKSTESYTTHNEAWWRSLKRQLANQLSVEESSKFRSQLSFHDYETLTSYKAALQLSLNDLLKAAVDLSAEPAGQEGVYRAILEHANFKILKTLSENIHRSPFELASKIDTAEAHWNFSPNEKLTLADVRMKRLRAEAWEILFAECLARKTDRELKLIQAGLGKYTQGDRDLAQALSEAVAIAAQNREHPLQTPTFDYPWREMTAQGFLKELRRQEFSEKNIRKELFSKKKSYQWYSEQGAEERAGEKLALGEEEEALAWANLGPPGLERTDLLRKDSRYRVQLPGLTIRGLFLK